MRNWWPLALLCGGCGLFGGSDFTISGRVGSITTAHRTVAALNHGITHVMAVDPEAASPHRTIAEVAGDGSFQLNVDAGRPYVFVFVDSHAVGADMAVAIFRAGTLDTVSPQLAGHLDMGDVTVDPEMQTATPGIAYSDLIASLGLSDADAEYLGSVDDLSLRYANPDIDGNGVLDLDEHHDFALDFHVRSNMRRGSAGGTNFTVADITDQFLPDDAVPVYNLTSAYVMYSATFDSTDYVDMGTMGMPMSSLTHGAAYAATNADGSLATKQSSFSALHFDQTKGWGADYDLEKSPGMELPGSGGMPATLQYVLGSTGTKLTFTNIVTRTKASLTDDGTLAIFIRLVSGGAAISAVDYKWMKRVGGAWVMATAQEIAMTISSEGGYISFHKIPNWSNESGIQIPADPAGTVAWDGDAMRPDDICGLAVSYDDKLGMRHFVGGTDANPGVTCTP